MICLISHLSKLSFVETFTKIDCATIGDNRKKGQVLRLNECILLKLEIT